MYDVFEKGVWFISILYVLGDIIVNFKLCVRLIN